MPRRTTVSGACGSFKTLLANGKSGVYPRVASDLRLPGLTSIDGYTRSRDVRVRPLSFRVSAQTRAGSGCTSATTCCVQAQTEPSHTAAPRSIVLDRTAFSVALLDRVTDPGETGDSSILASRRLPAVLALAIA